MATIETSSNMLSAIVENIHEQFRHLDEGELADYIPELTRADPQWFGIAITTVDGRQYLVGDTTVEFTIQSVSKPFTYGLAIESKGSDEVRKRIDVEPSGEAFNSISLKPSTGQPRNPMINAGAIAATSLIDAPNSQDRFEYILEAFSKFAGRELKMDESVYRSESETGWRNRGIAHLLRNFDILEGDVDEILEAYFMQCAILVDSQSLSVMGATLANGGINPISGERILSTSSVEKVNSVMSTCGMYDYSGNWAYEVGIPAKSGVGGGIIGVLPGQLSVAVFSPLLDSNFNSVRGIATFRELSKQFGLHLLNRPSLTDYVIRRSYTLGEFQSNRFRRRESQELLQKHGHRIRILELQGDLDFGALERLIYAYMKTIPTTDRVIIDLTKIGAIDDAIRTIIFHFARKAFKQGKRISLIDPKQILTPDQRRSLIPMAFVYDAADDALEDAEENLLAQFGRRMGSMASLPLAEMDLLAGLDNEALEYLQGLVKKCSYAEGDLIIQRDSEPDEIYFLANGIVGVHLGESDKRVSSFSPGMSFGELSLLQDQKRTADVVAVSQVEVYVLNKGDLESFRDAMPRAYQSVLHKIIESLSVRLVRANTEVAALK